VLGLCLVQCCGCRESGTVAPEGGVTDGGGKVGELATSGDVAKWLFEDRSGVSGVKFAYENGEEAGNFSILESLGGGLAVLDFDRDGQEDLWLAGGGSFVGREIRAAKNGLFRSAGSWRWTDVADVCGVAKAAWYSHGVSRTDFDHDGFEDVLITGYGGVQLWRNLGDGTFESLGRDSGLTDTFWSSSAAWGDLNGDRHPDVYVAHYVNWSWENDPFCAGGPNGGREICPPRSYTGLTDVVYYSNGDGTFRDASTEAGLAPEGKGLGVVIADLDGDQDNDVYVTNDTVANFLYENVGGGRLQDVSLHSGASLSSTGVPDGSMGVDICDYNNDGLPDVWVVNYERETNAMYQNAGGMVFRHVSQRIGLNAVGGMYVGWGTTAQDFDRDGDEDIFVSNGHVIRYPQNAALYQRALLLENESGRRLLNRAESAGAWFQEEHMGRGAVAADFDGDGDMDLAISRTRQPAVLLENRTPGKWRDWLNVRLVGRESGREPVGALVRLKAGEVVQSRFIRGGGSYGSSAGASVVFAVPGNVASAELEIVWPSGIQQRLSAGLNQQIIVLEGRSDGVEAVGRAVSVAR
jgi:hypothetical protein